MSLTSKIIVVLLCIGIAALLWFAFIQLRTQYPPQHRRFRKRRKKDD